MSKGVIGKTVKNLFNNNALDAEGSTSSLHNHLLPAGIQRLHLTFTQAIKYYFTISRT